MIDLEELRNDCVIVFMGLFLQETGDLENSQPNAEAFTDRNWGSIQKELGNFSLKKNEERFWEEAMIYFAKTRISELLDELKKLR